MLLGIPASVSFNHPYSSLHSTNVINWQKDLALSATFLRILIFGVTFSQKIWNTVLHFHDKRNNTRCRTKRMRATFQMYETPLPADLHTVNWQVPEDRFPISPFPHQLYHFIINDTFRMFFLTSVASDQHSEQTWFRIDTTTRKPCSRTVRCCIELSIFKRWESWVYLE